MHTAEGFLSSINVTLLASQIVFKIYDYNMVFFEMSDKSLDLTSEELKDIPASVFEEKEAEKLLLDFNSLSAIPSSFCEKLPHLTCLSLNGNMVESLPEDISKLILLNELYVKENLLCELPNSIVKLKCLQKLHITGNQIKLLPRQFSTLQNLTELIADENEIEELPVDFGFLQNLSYLELSYNNIRKLPDNFGSLTCLKEFSMSNNSLDSFPKSFQDLSSIEVIDVSYNSILALPENFAAAEKLKRLLLSNNIIASLPEWFSKLSRITEIDIHSNALQGTPFPSNFGNLTNLEHLDVRGNGIIDLPSSFGHIISLQKLHLGSAGEPERKRTFSSGNCIAKLPDSFPQLTNLTVLELDENDISELPSDFGCLSNIVYLNICHNDLKKLPDSFCELQQLKVCLLSINFITHLPENFGNLSSLEELKLDENMICELPESFGKLSNLVTLDLFHNKLKEVPPCLQNLKSLKTLDLKENEIVLTSDKVPDMYTSARYLVRNPELKDNWRGRKSEYIGDSLWVNDNEKTEGRDKENDVLSYALKYSTSLWQRHGDEGFRIPHNRTNGYSKDDSFKNTSKDIDEDDECWDEDRDDRNVSFDNMSSTLVDTSNMPNFEDSSDSDWEADVLENLTTFKKIYMHPVKTELIDEFVPSDIHAQHIPRPEVWDCIEDGQFDDADL